MVKKYMMKQQKNLLKWKKTCIKWVACLAKSLQVKHAY